jgi:hypothetical protein
MFIIISSVVVAASTSTSVLTPLIGYYTPSMFV